MRGGAAVPAVVRGVAEMVTGTAAVVEATRRPKASRARRRRTADDVGT